MSDMTADDRSTLTYVLVPGAWMGAWIWKDTAVRLRGAGHAALTPTLHGLEAATNPTDATTVSLASHVRQIIDLVDQLSPATPVVLVGHSYSGTVVGQVADRRRPRVVSSVHFGSFLPRNGRSLLDDWGDDPDARAAEQQQVRDDGMLWAPPPAQALESETDLSVEQRTWLSRQFVPHPGRTVLDPARLSQPVTEQPAVYACDSPDELAPELSTNVPDSWRLEVVGGGHWPMLTRPDDVHSILLSVAPPPS